MNRALRVETQLGIEGFFLPGSRLAGFTNSHLSGYLWINFQWDHSMEPYKDLFPLRHALTFRCPLLIEISC